MIRRCMSGIIAPEKNFIFTNRYEVSLTQDLSNEFYATLIGKVYDHTIKDQLYYTVIRFDMGMHTGGKLPNGSEESFL